MAKQNGDNLPQILPLKRLSLSKFKVKAGELSATLVSQIFPQGQEEAEPQTIKYTMDSPLKVHQDLITALERLRLHFAFLVELTEPMYFKGMKYDEIYTSKEVEDLLMHVDVYAVSWDDSHSGVVITGKKHLKSGKSFPMNAPFTEFEDDTYPFMDDLKKDLEVVVAEIHQYRLGKYANVNQLQIFQEESV